MFPTTRQTTSTSFHIPQGRLVGTLTGFSAPGGPCADAHGDVFVPDVFTSTIEEFAHGGSKPIGTLSEAADAYPDKCDVNRTNGDLAVSNDGNAFGQVRGGIAIYRALPERRRFARRCTIRIPVATTPRATCL